MQLPKHPCSSQLSTTQSHHSLLQPRHNHSGHKPRIFLLQLWRFFGYQVGIYKHKKMCIFECGTYRCKLSSQTSYGNSVKQSKHTAYYLLYLHIPIQHMYVYPSTDRSLVFSQHSWWHLTHFLPISIQ